ncbi:hypothetical protein TIFTF001_041406 [Ficus carica]|uniref:Uncharacterized protein n=1 Tax=Ficus carica TaxID=3494 RepID=A0AA88CTY8_FICCA|nr:hypothetical protein TIFTF001_043362 [Ficus carica]GMN30131.1 hypothetical protein TIFTF001_041406 [Ficus carica]
MSFNEQERTCSCTLRRSSITQDIARELLMLCYVVVVVAMRLYLLSESSLSYVYAVGKQPSAMVDTRWKGMAGQTVKCGKSSCYAFCSL